MKGIEQYEEHTKLSSKLINSFLKLLTLFYNSIYFVHNIQNKVENQIFK